MTIVEPLLLGAIASIILLPIATYALGFYPSLCLGYVLFAVLWPIVMAVPVMLTLAVVTAGACWRRTRIQQRVSAC